MKRFAVFSFVLFCAAALAQAVPFTASWIEGDVFVRAGSAWKAVEAGDKVDSSSLVKLGLGALAEFTSGSRKIAVSTEGTFNLDSLLSSSGAQREKRSSVMDKMGRLVGKQGPRSTVVAGVRGDFEGAPEKTNWAVDDDDPAAIADEAEHLVSQKRFADAAKKYDKAATDALGDKREEYRYDQAWCLASSDNSIGAIKILRPMSANGSFSIARAILLARLSLDTGAPKEAAAVLDEVSRNPTLVGDDAAMVKDLREEARQALTKK
jgi:hypothetical protein